MISWRSPMAIRAAAIALTVFILGNLPPPILARIPGYAEFVRSLPRVLRWLWEPFSWAVLIALGLWIAHRLPPWRAGRELGLRRPVLGPFVFGMICCAPMTVLPAFLVPLRREIDGLELAFSAGVWVLAEEVLYRGYCFNQLHRRAGWNLFVAAAATGVVFGLVHLWNASIQSLDLSSQLFSIALIGAGGIVFAWLFAAWSDNVWAPFFVHGLMNLGWELWNIDTHPAAGWLVITLRVGTVVLAIGLTIVGRRRGWWGLRRAPDARA